MHISKYSEVSKYISSRQNLTDSVENPRGLWLLTVEGIHMDIWDVSETRIHVEIQGKYLNWGWNEREVSPKHVNIFIQQRKTSFITLLGPFICHQIVFWTFWGKHKRNFHAEISPGIPQEKGAVMSTYKKFPFISPEFPQGNHALHFTGSNSWHTYAYSFFTTNLTYKGVLPINCMQASLKWNASQDLLYYYDKMNNNAGSLYNVVSMLKDYTLIMRTFSSHTSCWQITSWYKVITFQHQYMPQFCM